MKNLFNKQVEFEALRTEVIGMEVFNKERFSNDMSPGYDDEAFQQVASQMRELITSPDQEKSDIDLLKDGINAAMAIINCMGLKASDRIGGEQVDAVVKASQIK